MARFLNLYGLSLFLVALAGCTGESVRVVLPEGHPANPSAAEAPFVMPPDPFAGLPPSVSPPSSEQPPGHRHGHQHGGMGGKMSEDEMRMDDMRMDDDKGGATKHGGHDGTAAGDMEKGR